MKKVSSLVITLLLTGSLAAAPAQRQPRTGGGAVSAIAARIAKAVKGAIRTHSQPIAPVPVPCTSNCP